LVAPQVDSAPDDSLPDDYSVQVGCPDDSPAGLQAADSPACLVWHSADFPAAHFQVGPVCQHSAGCPDGPLSAAPVFLVARS